MCSVSAKMLIWLWVPDHFIDHFILLSYKTETVKMISLPLCLGLFLKPFSLSPFLLSFKEMMFVYILSWLSIYLISLNLHNKFKRLGILHTLQFYFVAWAFRCSLPTLQHPSFIKIKWNLVLRKKGTLSLELWDRGKSWVTLWKGPKFQGR